jgi:hypothetical protein
MDKSVEEPVTQVQKLQEVYDDLKTKQSFYMD